MKRFLVDAAERVVATAAEAALGAIGATLLIQDVDWPLVAGTAGLAAIVAALKALAARHRGDPENASLLP